MKINDLQNFVFQNTRYLLINYPEYGKNMEHIENTLVDILEKSYDMLESKRLLMEKLEILQKWTAICIPQEKIESVITVYKKRLDEVVLNRDTYRSPDQKGEEEKYKYLERVNSNKKSEHKNEEKIIPNAPVISLFPTENTKIKFSLPNDIGYYHRKNKEIRRIIDNNETVGLLSLNDLIEDVYEYNYSEEREAHKTLNVRKIIERMTKAIKAIQVDDKEAVFEKFGEFIVEPFGSSVNGIYMHNKKDKSDLDISINFYYNPAVNKEEVLQTILPAIHYVSNK